MVSYPDKVLINRTGKEVRFSCGGIEYSFKTGETRTLEGFTAYHALNHANTGLEEFTPEIEEEESKKNLDIMPDYNQMPWTKLISRAKKYGWKPGMVKEDVLKLLEEKWTQKHLKSMKTSLSEKSSEG